MSEAFHDSIGLYLAPSFEVFAMDHTLHRHCSGCQGCILDSRHFVLTSTPLYCVSCRDKIAEALPQATPWEWVQ